MTTPHSITMASNGLSPHILRQRSHILKLTHSVYVRIFHKLWPSWDTSNIEEIIKEIEKRRPIHEMELEQLLSKSPNYFGIPLLWVLLSVALASPVDGVLKQYLDISHDLLDNIINKVPQDYASLQENCIDMKDSLLKLLMKVEESKGIDLSGTKKEVMADFPVSTLFNIDILSDSLAFLLPTVFVVIFENIRLNNLAIIGDFTRDIYLPKYQRWEIENCNDISELSLQTQMNIIFQYVLHAENVHKKHDEVMLKEAIEITNIGYRLVQAIDIDDESCNALSNKCYQAVEGILRGVRDLSNQDIESLLVRLSAALPTSLVTSNLPQTTAATSATSIMSPKTSMCNLPHQTSTTMSISLASSLSTLTVTSTQGQPAVLIQNQQTISPPSTMPSSSLPLTTSLTSISQSTVISVSSSPQPLTPSLSSSQQSIATSVQSHSSSLTSTIPSSSSSTASAVTSALGPSSVYTQEDMNVVRVFCALRKGGPAVKTFAKVFELLFPQGLSEVINYCKGTLRYTGNMLKSFTRDEKEHIRNNTPLSELDITLLYKVIGRVCITTLGHPDTWDNPSRPLGHLLYCVKGSRNFQSHDVVVYTNHDVAKVANNLKDWLKKILDLLASETQVDLSGVEQDVTDELNKIFTDSLPVDSFQDYTERIKVMREELAQETMSKAREELKREYDNERLRIVNPVSWYHNPDSLDHTMWNISDLYTELEIIDTMGYSNNSTVMSKDILTLLTSQNKVLVIEGAAGSGKTSICKFLLQCWKCNVTAKVDGLVEVDLMIFIQCRHVRSEALVNLLRESLFPESLKSVQSSDVILSLSNARILFVIDGYDEANYKARNVVEEALEKFPSSSAIITTRPEFRPEVDLMISRCRASGRRVLLTVYGFEDHNRSVYIHKIFHQIGKDPQDFLLYLQNVDEYLGSFTRLPLTLALLSLIWVHRTKNFTKDMTLTQLYQRIVTVFLNRFIDRQRQRPTETRHQKDIERKAFSWLQTLGKVAWNGLKEGRTILNDTEEDLMRVKSDELGLDATDGLSCLLQCQITATPMGDETLWEFIHKTVQEHLSANNIATDIKENNITLVDALSIQDENDHNSIKKYIHVIEFVGGMCAERKCLTEEVSQQLLQLLHVQTPWAFNAIYSLSKESESSPTFKKCLKKMFDGDTILETLEDYNVQHILFVLQQTSLGLPASINVVLNSEDMSNTKDLVDLLLARGCHPRLHVRVRGPKCVQRTVSALKTFQDPSHVPITFLCDRNNTFTDLLNLWPWDTLPLALEFPKQIFSLLWLQLSACMAVKKTCPVKVEYKGHPDGNKAMEFLCTILNADVVCHPSNSAQITIFSGVTPFPSSTSTSVIS